MAETTLDGQAAWPTPGQGGQQYLPTHPQGQSLADVLERVLDKGIVIAGDIQVRLLDIELLTIKLRLLVASVDKAREMGINWWESDEFVSMGRPGDEDGHESSENGDGDGSLRQLTERVKELEGRLEGGANAAAPREQRARGRR
jgi:hypothetical protein